MGCTSCSPSHAGVCAQGCPSRRAGPARCAWSRTCRRPRSCGSGTTPSAAAQRLFPRARASPAAGARRCVCGQLSSPLCFVLAVARRECTQPKNLHYVIATTSGEAANLSLLLATSCVASLRASGHVSRACIGRRHTELESRRNGLSDRSSGGGSKARTVVSAVAIRDPALMPAPDAKPEYHNLTAIITSIDSEQSMYYMAAPDTGRKARRCPTSPAPLICSRTRLNPLPAPAGTCCETVMWVCMCLEILKSRLTPGPRICCVG